MSDALHRQSPVLVDTNVIIEAHRTHSWRALSHSWQVETVEVALFAAMRKLLLLANTLLPQATGQALYGVIRSLLAQPAGRASLDDHQIPPSILSCEPPPKNCSR